MTISPSNHNIGVAGETFILSCSADITPHPLPKNVPFPSFQWFYGPTNASLPSGVTVSDVINSGNTYTSTMQFTPLQGFHAGIYTCRLGGNEGLAATSTIITITGKMRLLHSPFNFYLFHALIV